MAETKAKNERMPLNAILENGYANNLRLLQLLATATEALDEASRLVSIEAGDYMALQVNQGIEL
jgi:hypothetical protein